MKHRVVVTVEGHPIVDREFDLNDGDVVTVNLTDVGVPMSINGFVVGFTLHGTFHPVKDPRPDDTIMAVD